MLLSVPTLPTVIQGEDILKYPVEKDTSSYLDKGHLRCDDPTPYTWFYICFHITCHASTIGHS